MKRARELALLPYVAEGEPEHSRRAVAIVIATATAIATAEPQATEERTD